VKRVVRIALTAAGVASGYLLVKGALAYRAERRRQAVFPAKDANALLNPLRRLVMPVRRTLERFDLAEGQTVLELGPGPGYYSIEASRIIGPGGRLVCLDIQRGMIEQLSARLAEAGVANTDLLVGDAINLPLRSGSVDRAFLVTVLGEIPDAAAALAELRRVLRPGGLLGFEESLGDPDYVLVGKLRGLCAAAGFMPVAHHRNVLGYTAVFRAG
jgi:ubiquinone/menaquinone biosynthesis C-methylase UbiE